MQAQFFDKSLKFEEQDRQVSYSNSQLLHL